MHATKAAFRSALVSGLIFFAIVMSLGQVLAADNASQGGGVGVIVSGTAPVISNFDIQDVTPVTILGTQIQVGQTYFFQFRVNAPNGWVDITHVYARVWYTGSDPATTYAGQTTGANYKASLSATYSNTPAPAAGDFSAIDGNMNFVVGSSAVTPVDAQTFDFSLAFNFHNQMRAAKAPTLGTGGYTTGYSWNAEIEVSDASANTVILQTQRGTGDYAQFGVAAYSSISFTGPWNALSSLNPGGNANTNAVTITRAANFDFQLYAYFSTDFTSGSHTMAVANNVKLLQTGDMPGDVTFTGIGSGIRAYVLGSSTPTYHTMDSATDSGTVDVAFNILVPLGTAVGTYSANVVFFVQQQTPLP